MANEFVTYKQLKDDCKVAYMAALAEIFNSAEVSKTRDGTVIITIEAFDGSKHDLCFANGAYGDDPMQKLQLAIAKGFADAANGDHI